MRKHTLLSLGTLCFSLAVAAAPLGAQAQSVNREAAYKAANAQAAASGGVKAIKLRPQALPNETQLQFCELSFDYPASCGTASGLGSAFSAASAYQTLTNLGCVYQFSKPTTSTPGYDTFSCVNSTQLPQATVLVQLDGDSPSSYAFNVVFMGD